MPATLSEKWWLMMCTLRMEEPRALRARRMCQYAWGPQPKTVMTEAWVRRERRQRDERDVRKGVSDEDEIRADGRPVGVKRLSVDAGGCSGVKLVTPRCQYINH